MSMIVFLFVLVLNSLFVVQTTYANEPIALKSCVSHMEDSIDEDSDAFVKWLAGSNEGEPTMLSRFGNDRLLEKIKRNLNSDWFALEEELSGCYKTKCTIKKKSNEFRFIGEVTTYEDESGRTAYEIKIHSFHLREKNRLGFKDY